MKADLRDVYYKPLTPSRLMQSEILNTGFISLEQRRVRGNLIQVFRMIEGFDMRDYFDFSLENRTCGKSFKLLKKRSNVDLRKHLFFHDGVDILLE